MKMEDLEESFIYTESELKYKRINKLEYFYWNVEDYPNMIMLYQCILKER